MEKLSLKVVIAGRTYPLTIKKEEERIITEAAEKINNNIKKLQGNYAVKDMQDLLAMTTLQFAVQMGSENKNSSPLSDSSSSSIDSKEILRIIEKINTQL